MNFETFWGIIVDKNASLSDTSNRVTLNKDAFKKAINLAFDQGMKHQNELNSPNCNPKEKDKTPYDSSNIFGDLFGGLFGGKK